MSTGKVVQVIGAVVDVEFPRADVPKVYNALNVGELNLTMEVQQQLGDGIVRCVAMGSSEGLKRGLAVSNTGKAISVPVGTKTLGRIMDVLGDPIDEKGPIGEETRWEIHRKSPQAASGHPACPEPPVAPNAPNPGLHPHPNSNNGLQ